MNYKAKGIVLHTMKYGETSLLAFLLTDALGRQNYLIQGASKNSKGGRRSALFQPMFVLDFEGVSTPHSQLHRMKEVANTPHASIPFDVRKGTVALFMAEVLYRLVRESEQNTPLFDFVLGAVQALDALPDAASAANFHLWFLTHLSFHLGFLPGNEYIDNSWFDIVEGAFTRLEPSHKISMSPADANVLGQMMNTGADELASIHLSRGQRSSFLTAMLTYFGYHLEGIRSVKSVEILREVF